MKKMVLQSCQRGHRCKSGGKLGFEFLGQQKAVVRFISISLANSSLDKADIYTLTAKHSNFIGKYKIKIIKAD